MKGTIRPTPAGGVIVSGDGEYASYKVEFNASGEVVGSWCEIRNPRTADRSRGPGDRYHDLIAQKYGIKPCQRCIELIDEMNELGVEGCKQAKARIIDDIWQHRDKLKGWRSIAVKLPLSEIAAKMELGRLFDQAVGVEAKGTGR